MNRQLHLLITVIFCASTAYASWLKPNLTEEQWLWTGVGVCSFLLLLISIAICGISYECCCRKERQFVLVPEGTDFDAVECKNQLSGGNTRRQEKTKKTHNTRKANVANL